MKRHQPRVFRHIAAFFIMVTVLPALLPFSLYGQTSTSKSKDLTSNSNVITRQKNPLNDENISAKASRSVFFEENRGQHHEKVKFASRRGRDTVYLTPTEAVFMLPLISDEEKKDFGKFDFFGETTLEKRFAELGKKPFGEKELLQERSKPRKFVPLKMKMVGANPNAQMSGTEETPTKINYFKGNDASKPRTDIPTFGRVVYENVYNGIGLEWYGTAEGEYEYDFKVKPNADLRQIELEFEGASKLETDDNGNLLIYTKAGIVRQNKPYSYQNVNNEQKKVTSNFELRGERKVGFTVENYDKQRELVIDPTLVYSTYIGGSGYHPNIIPRNGGDYAGAIGVDPQGSAVISTATFSTDYPVTTGSYDTTINGDVDIAVSRFSSDGRTLIYSTYIGGERFESVYVNGSLKIDSQGNACIFGYSSSRDFPTTEGAFQRIQNGGVWDMTYNATDCVIFKLNQAGNQLIFSTYFGGWRSPNQGVGTGSEVAGDMVLDADDNIYITGYTDSRIFPVSSNAFQTEFISPQNSAVRAFAAKLNGTGSARLACTYFSGSLGSGASGIAVDGARNIYIAGGTRSPDLPTTEGAFDRTYNTTPLTGSADGFVAKFNPDLSGLIYSTFLGGSQGISLAKIKVDAQGQAYIAGQTYSTDFPVTPNAYRTVGSGDDQTLTQLNQSGSALLYSTYFPSGISDLIVEANGNLILTGYAGSTLAYTPNAFDRSPSGDAGLVRFNPATNQILYATAFGGKMGDPIFDGNHYDGAIGVAMDAVGNIYIAGTTGTTDLPTTEGAFDRTWNGYTDNFVAKFSFASNSIANLSGRTRRPTPLGSQTKGISRIRIKLTDHTTGEVRYQMTRPTGRYEFRGLPANRNYTIEVSDKRRFTNTSETIQNAEGDIGGIDFILMP